MDDSQRRRLLALLPQTRPFRFVDELLEVDREHVLCKYTFRQDEFFYPGHFPGEPITPGVILTEAMAQAMAVHAIYLLSLDLPAAEVENHRALLTDAQVEFRRPVLPGQTVYMRSVATAWRRKKLRAEVDLSDGSDQVFAFGTMSGMGVSRA